MSQATALSFSTSQVIKDAWQLLQQKWSFLLGVWSAVFVAAFVMGMIQGALMQANTALGVLAWLATQIAIMIMTIGSIKVILKVVRGETTEIKELFTGSKYLVQYILASLVTGLVVFLGFLLLVVPGIIWSLKYMFTLFLVIDDGSQFSDAMAKSAEMTEGIKWKLFGFSWALCGLNLLGLLPLGFGLIVTIPVTSLALYVLYVHLKKQLAGRPALKTAV